MDTFTCPIPPIPENETERLEVLKAFQLLDTPPEVAFDRITSLAARFFSTPICLVSLLDTNRQWFKSRFGLQATETPRRLAFCAYVILENAPDVLVVSDATQDPRFKDNNLVTGEPHIRFYAGAPLILKDGLKLGTLCVIDTKPRTFKLEDKMILTDLAAMVVSQIQLRRELNQTHRSYISATAHNLRTPLASLELCLEALSKSIIDLEQKDALDQAHMNLEIMKWTVEKGISTARNHFALAPQVPDLKCFKIKDMIYKLQKATSHLHKRVPLNFQVTPNCPEESSTDSTAVFHSLLDLISNACEHTNEGQVDVIFEYIKKNSNFIKITVKDTGVGVPEEIRKNLFVQPFLGDKKSGIGCYGIRINMELINGSYGYAENQPKGSIFWIEYPDVSLNKQELMSVEIESKKEEKPETLSTQTSILIVDDCSTIRTMLQKILKSEGFCYVDTAENGREGFEALKKNIFKVAFVDFLMPVMLGIECVSLYRKWEINNRSTQTIIIGISANAEDSDVQHALKHGMNFFLKKPLSIKTIREIMKKIESEPTKPIKITEEGKQLPSEKQPSKNQSLQQDNYKFLVKLLTFLLLLASIWIGYLLIK